MTLSDYGPKPGGPTHPPSPAPPPMPPPPPPPHFRPPQPSTPLNAAIDCARAWGAALVAIKRLLTGRPV